MTLGWQGFTLEHPDDWAPVHLNGHRDQGYVRIASTSRIACQVRWQEAQPITDLPARLKTYLSRLEKDSKKAKVDFDADLETVDGRLTYRYHGIAHGRGALFHDAASRRVFFVEIVSPKHDSLLGPLRQLLGTFRCDTIDRWSLLGLDVLLPQGLRVERPLLQAGHTRLVLNQRGVRVTASRWGFGEQLVQRHGIEGWAREALRLPKAKAVQEPQGLRLLHKGIVPTIALVQHQVEKNQLIALIVRSRRKEWNPQWDWIV